MAENMDDARDQKILMNAFSKGLSAFEDTQRQFERHFDVAGFGRQESSNATTIDLIGDHRVPKGVRLDLIEDVLTAHDKAIDSNSRTLDYLVRRVEVLEAFLTTVVREVSIGARNEQRKAAMERNPASVGLGPMVAREEYVATGLGSSPTFTPTFAEND